MPAPTISTTVSVPTSQCAPCRAFFDATATVTDLSDDFADPIYIWLFGDGDAPVFTTGARAGQSSNIAFGPIAAHVYRTPGVKTWALLVMDGTLSSYTSGTITVADPDTYFAGTNTVAVSADTLPVAGVGGVPAGALCVTNADWDSIVNSYKGKRVLLKCGDTFAHDSQPSNVEVAVQRYGSHGTGARPVIQYDPAVTSAMIIFDNGVSEDVVFYGIDIDGNGATPGLFNDINGVTDDLVFDDCIIRDVEDGIVTTSDSVLGATANFCTVGPIIGGSGRNAFFLTGGRAAVIGNDVQAVQIGEHCLRSMGMQKGVFSDNNLSGSSTDFGGKATFALRPNGGRASQYIINSHNKIHVRDYAGLHMETSVNDVLSFGNFYTTDGGDCIRTNGNRLTVSNEVINATNSTGAVILLLDNSNDPGIAQNIRLFNNTIYNETEQTNWAAMDIDAGCVTGIVAKNNLVYAPGVTSTATVINDASTVATVGGNSSNAQAKSTSPEFAGPLTSVAGFRVSVASYAVQDGVSAVVPVSALGNDALGGFDKTGDNRVGAVVPRAQALCRGVASP